MPSKQAETFRQFMMVAFWLLVFALAPGKLTITYLALTMIVLFLFARRTRADFGEIVGNNNWVFCAALLMTLVSLIMAFKNPLVPLTLLERFRGDVAYHPLADDMLLGKLNRFYFGETFTSGWRTAALIYAFLTLVAIPVSFTDDAIKVLRDKRSNQSGAEWESFMKKHVVIRIGEAIIHSMFGRR